jgi:Ca-activated chloride channel family protein
MIEFARTWAFALLPLPLAAWFLLPAMVSRNAIAVPPGVWQMLDRVRAPGDGAMGLLKRGILMRAAAWALMVAALAGPETLEARLLAPTGRDVMVAMDLSASMGERRKDAAEDESARQIDIVGPFVTRLIEGRRGDRVGLIAFGSDAYLISPLTFDTRAVAGMLPEVSIGLPGRRTDLGQAIGLTVQILRDEPKGERVLVMISDGEANVGDLAAMDAAKLAVEFGITIHVVGFSSEVSPENAEHMTEIAELTGGRYFEATSAESLAGVEAAIAQVLPRATGDDPDYVRRDWAWLPSLLALALLVVIGRQELAGA